MTRIFTFLLGLLWATALCAQTYPDRTGTGLNDFAQIVPPEVEERLLTRLETIAADHETELVVVTLSSLRFYAQDSTIEDYATGLFNAWGIGDATRDTGLLLIVFRDDRELRIAAGEGFEPETRKLFDRVIDENVLPLFREGSYAAGIEAGVEGLLTRVIAPVSAPSDVPVDADRSGGGNVLLYVLGALAAAVAGVVFLNRRAAAKFAARACASCGATGLTRERDVIRPATADHEGAAETRITCPSCGHVETQTQALRKLKAKPDKGGGQTKGEGSTGRW